MPEKFDPYHEWLGIPAGEQPPHHYRLLGIPPFEESPTVIENAADRQMAHLRTFQAGKHAADSQRLLNEVAAAKVCLLNPGKRTAYDQLLRRKDRPTVLPTARPLPDPSQAGLAEIFETPIAGTSAIGSKRPAKKSRPNPTPLIVVAALTVAAVGLALWVAVGHDNTPSNGGIAKVGNPATAAAPAKEAAPKSPGPPKKETAAPATMNTPVPMGPKEEPKSPDLKSETPKSLPVAVAEAKPQPKEVNTAAANVVAAHNWPAAKPEPDEEKAPAKKLAPPSVEEQKRLMGEIDEVYKPSAAKDQAAKAALAHKLLEDGRKNEGNRAEQFVLLRRAGEIARDAGEADLMLEAVDAIVDAGFDIRPCPVKARLLKQLVEHGTAQVSTVSASCVKFAEEAAASGAVDEALDVLEVAKKSLPKSIVRAHADLRTAKAALAHARTPADKEEQEKKVEEAQGAVDSVKSAELAVAECAKGLQEARLEHEAISAAEEKLKTAPDDPEACLTLGRWYCFQQDDWDEGLKLLAKGSDDALKSLAAEELASRPSKAEDKVARGDAWWESAEKAAGKTKAAMRRRAGDWYQEALPDLAPGLGKTRVEKRLAEAADEPPPKANSRAVGIRPPLAVAPFNEKTAKQHQARWARYLHVPVVQTNSIGMKLVLIPPGEFLMGSPKELIEEELRLHGDDGWYKDHLPSEGPQHRVRITKPHWLGATDVTQQEYQRVMGSNPSKFQGDPKRPVEQVSWDDAVEFCRRLSELPGEQAAKRRYALPTEAQWEHACRAGTTTRWYSGDDEAGLAAVAWCDKNAGGQTHPVGQRPANAWGLYDMHGNVWQWCQDWYDQEYYAKSPVENPTGPATGSYRVLRGGPCWRPAAHCRSAHRHNVAAGYRDHDLGFRVCLVIADTAAEPAKTSRSINSAQASAGSTANKPPPAVAPFNEKTARQYQTRWAKYLHVPVVQANSIGMTLVLIPPGEFDMGSPKELIDGELKAHGDDGWYKNHLPSEGPQHHVRITKPFWLGATDVTQEEYQRVMGSNPSKFQGGSRRPVEQVLWDEAVDFCRRLSELPREKAAKRRYGLPTDAQWEYACRAGTTTRRYSGDDEPGLLDVAWFNMNAGGQTHPVGQKRPNVWGLYDMYGNVWQWCRDWQDMGYYARSPTDDPAGPSSGGNHLLRGGSWNYGANYCRSACHLGYPPSERYSHLGFRVCLVIAETAAERAKTSRSNDAAQATVASTANKPPLAVAPFNEKTAKQHQSRWAKYLRVPVIQTNSIAMKLVLIPPGEFLMGSPKELIEEELKAHGDDQEYKGHLPSEGPQHRARITKPYWLGATSVTQGEYQRVVGSNPSNFAGDPKKPVEQVTWDEAVDFCRKLLESPGEEAAGRKYGLPTEAQWEHACRAGTTTRWYSGGDEPGLVDVAWFNKNAVGQTHSVGQKLPNAWGLYDMHGNVWDWCQDRDDKENYTNAPTDDPAGPADGAGRVFRGGCWDDPAYHCRSAYRNSYGPGSRNRGLGFRVCLVPADK